MPNDRDRRVPPRSGTTGAAAALGMGVVCLAAALARDGAADARNAVETPFVRAPSAAARVTLGPGGADLRVAGDLMDGVATRVAALLAAHPDVRRIHLTSDGGLVAEGLALGRLIAERGLDTYVPDACASACTLAFVRGHARYLGAGGRLGFHAPYETGPFGRAVAVDARVERAAYRAAGLDADFTAEALAVSPDALWMPEAERLIEAGAVTEIVETDRFPDSTLDDDDGPDAARGQVLRNLPVLAEADPSAVDRLAAWYRDGYRAGRTEADALDGLRRRASAALKHLLHGADDATVRAFGHAALAAMRKAEAGACEAIAEGDVVAIEETLRNAPPPVPSLPALIARARRQAAADDDTVRRRPGPRGQVPCGAGIEAVRQTLDRPVREAASRLRALLLDAAPGAVAEIGAP